MTPYYHDDWLTIYQGDVRAVLPELASDSVDCIVTSPPYWGLRDYGTAEWSGGDEACDHTRAYQPRSERPNPTGSGIGKGGSSFDAQAAGTAAYRHTCGKCGAVRQDAQLGLEPTPEEYVANLVAIFRELRRVLKPSGTCWLNLGDSYNAGTTAKAQNSPNNDVGYWQKDRRNQRIDWPGLKPKDLCGIPWRVAFALQADGWYLRSDIIWSKPNPMPESVTDRPTKAHEYLFLLTKSARYYFDADAVREAPADYERKGGTATWAEDSGHTNGKGSSTFHQMSNAGRNLRSVWTIATRPYPGAHFAVFPPELPERCIKAGSSERGVCPECGAPWERVVQLVGGQTTGRTPAQVEAGRERGVLTSRTQTGIDRFVSEHRTTGWRPPGRAKAGTYEAEAYGNPHSERRGPKQNFGNGQARSTTWSGCAHDAEPVPAVVLDPFAGSGTTGMVANRLSRRAILIDLNGDYLKQQLTRNAQTPLGLGA